MAEFTLELVANVSSTSGTAVTSSLSLVNHVHSRPELFIYSDKIRPESVPIAYLENQEIDSWRNLQLVDRSYSLPANSEGRVGLRSSWAVSTSVSWSSAYKDILATNQTFVDEFGKTRPLFYRHSLPADTVECSLRVVSGGARHDVDSGYRVDLEAGLVYTNYQNFFNSDTGAYRLYFVVSTSSDGTLSHTLLNAEPVAREATWEDIDLTSGKLIDTYPLFTREKNSSGYTFHFNFGDTWYIQPLSKSLIQPKLPAGREPEDPWWLRFTAGDLTTVVDGSSRRYYLPEFDQQAFIPSKPTRYSTYSRLLYVNPSVLSATRGNLNISPDDGLHMVIFAYDTDGVLIRAFTTDTSKNGVRHSDTDVFYEADTIASWDNPGGLVHLAVKVHPSWTLQAQYYYDADDYEYTGVDLNPLSNKQALNYLYVFYIIPEADADDKAIHHLVVDPEGVIVETSQADGFSYDNLQLFDSSGNYNSDTIIGMKYVSDVDATTFLTEYTAGFSNAYSYTILAEVSVLDSGHAENQIVYDVRRPGLRLTDESFKAAIRANPRLLQSTVGYGEDGQEVPQNAVMYIRAPVSLLEEYGGLFTVEQAEIELRRHLNSASHPVIEWEYYSPELSGNSTTVGQVDLEWTWEAPALDYKLYRRTNPTGEWDLLYTESSPAFGAISYSDTTVTSGEVYYYVVRVNDGTYDYPFGNSLGVKVA